MRHRGMRRGEFFVRGRRGSGWGSLHTMGTSVRKWVTAALPSSCRLAFALCGVTSPTSRIFLGFLFPFAVLQQGYLGRKKETGLQIDIICGSLATGKEHGTPGNCQQARQTKQVTFLRWERDLSTATYLPQWTLVRKREYTRWHFWKMAFTNRPQSSFCLQKNLWDHSSM